MPLFEKGGAPGPGRRKGVPDSVPRSLKQLFELYDRDPRLAAKALRTGLQLKAPANLPYLRLLVEYKLVVPKGEADMRQSVIFWLSKGPPGGYDPLAAPPPGQEAPAPRPQLAEARRVNVTPPAPPPPEGFAGATPVDI